MDLVTDQARDVQIAAGSTAAPPSQPMRRRFVGAGGSASNGGSGGRSDWGGLSEHLLLLVMGSLEPADLTAAHLVARGWRDAACLATRSLRFARQPPDTERIKQTFPHLRELVLERMQLSKQNLACIAGLPGLAVLALRVCRLPESGSVSALGALAGLQELELCEVVGPAPEEVDAAIQGLTNLHRLHVESRTAACAAPTLRSLAFLPRIRQLSVKEARPRHGFVGLTNLGSLQELQALELRGATVTNSIMRRLAELTGLTQLRVPEASLVTDQGFEALAGLTGLRELDVSCWRMQADGPVSDTGAAHLASLTGLTSLSLAGRAPVTAHGLAFMGQRFTHLQSLDLSRVQLDQGSAAFLWRCTQLTSLRIGGTKMTAAQFDGLAGLAHLAELDVSGTQFDDACCAMLSGMADLAHLNLAHTQVSSRGVGKLNAAHAGRLRHLQLDGCRVSMRAVLRTLRCQPGGACLWDPARRGYLSRWVNVCNTLLMATTPEPRVRQRLRLRYAPEHSWAQQGAMAVLAAGIFVGHAAVLLATLMLLLLLPLAGVLLGSALLLMRACGRSPPSGSILAAAAKGEVFLTAVLVGVLSVEVPPPAPPGNPLAWH